jgi:phosphate uptake regulator
MRDALVVHHLERVSDHGVEIGERTNLLASGERSDDAMQRYLDRNAHRASEAEGTLRLADR